MEERKKIGQLVLSRKLNEKIVINSDITITVCEIRRDRKVVRLGITAPKEISILRKELIDGSTGVVPRDEVGS